MRFRLSTSAAAASIAVAALVAGTAVAFASTSTAAARPSTYPKVTPHYLATHYNVVASCGARPAKGFASCYAKHLVLKPGMTSRVSPSAIIGYQPADIQSAYNIAGLQTTNTVAIVDAYGYPRAASDLAKYRAQWGLSACTVASGCLTILNQTGGTTGLPAFNLGWAQEQALDLDAVSAACPSCKIVLVEAKTSSFTNLGTAVNTAAAHAGVKAISNSYGSSGDAPDSTYATYYKHSGIAVTASAGDDDYQGPSYPASSRWVTAVGGTSLVTATGTTRGWAETVWNGAPYGTGSGCSTLNGHPTQQSPTVTMCSKRAMNDVSAVADPDTGLAVYAPTSSTASAWNEYGGTSLSSPIIASVYALSGNTAGFPNNLAYTHASSLNDVTVGSNGTCTPTIWCTAGVGWDGPTGMGTPNGVGAF